MDRRSKLEGKKFQFCAVLGIFITPKNMNKLPTFNKGKNWALLKRWWIQNKERNVLNWTLLNNNKISQLWILYQKVNIQTFSCKFDQMWTNVQRIFLSAKMHFHSYTCCFGNVVSSHSSLIPFKSCLKKWAKKLN